MSRRVFIVDGSPVRAGPAYGWAEEFSILRGKLVIGVLRAYPAGRTLLACGGASRGVTCRSRGRRAGVRRSAREGTDTQRTAMGARYRSPRRRWAQY